MAGFTAVGGSDEDAGVDQQHGSRSDALGELGGGGRGTFSTDVEGLSPPRCSAPDEGFERIIEPGGQLVDERLAGDPASLGLGVQPGSEFFE